MNKGMALKIQKKKERIENLLNKLPNYRSKKNSKKRFVVDSKTQLVALLLVKIE
jgi:hypothetical protein